MLNMYIHNINICIDLPNVLCAHVRFVLMVPKVIFKIFLDFSVAAIQSEQSRLFSGGGVNRPHFHSVCTVVLQ